jgi:hypothetical protein
MQQATRYGATERYANRPVLFLTGIAHLAFGPKPLLLNFIAHAHPPAARLSAQNCVPVTIAHVWVKSITRDNEERPFCDIIL